MDRISKCKVLNQPDVKDTLEKLHTNFVLIPADKAANNVIMVCKKYYIETLVKELGINTTSNTNSTSITCTESFYDILRTHTNFVNSVGLEMSEEEKNLPYAYWTPKLHNTPLKHRFIAGSSKCTTKDLLCLLTKFLSTIKDGLIKYCATETSRNMVNNMWILKNSLIDLLLFYFPICMCHFDSVFLWVLTETIKLSSSYEIFCSCFLASF